METNPKSSSPPRQWQAPAPDTYLSSGKSWFPHQIFRLQNTTLISVWLFRKHRAWMKSPSKRYPSEYTAAYHLGISKNTVRAADDELVELGWLTRPEVVPNPGRKSVRRAVTRYIVNDAPVGQPVTNKADEPVGQPVTNKKVDSATAHLTNKLRLVGQPVTNPVGHPVTTTGSSSGSSSSGSEVGNLHTRIASDSAEVQIIREATKLGFTLDRWEDEHLAPVIEGAWSRKKDAALSEAQATKFFEMVQRARRFLKKKQAQAQAQAQAPAPAPAPAAQPPRPVEPVKVEPVKPEPPKETPEQVREREARQAEQARQRAIRAHLYNNEVGHLWFALENPDIKACQPLLAQHQEMVKRLGITEQDIQDARAAHKRKVEQLNGKKGAA